MYREKSLKARLEKRAILEKRCLSKERHATHSAALLRVHPGSRDVKDAYECKFCGGWHIGTYAADKS
jgi:hypothetical protein